MLLLQRTEYYWESFEGTLSIRYILKTNTFVDFVQLSHSFFFRSALLRAVQYVTPFQRKRKNVSKEQNEHK
jgi:hypothetical protein